LEQDFPLELRIGDDSPAPWTEKIGKPDLKRYNEEIGNELALIS